MIIYPAIDIINGSCVRLTQGRYDSVTVYESDPAEVAKRWETLGAEYVHLVDLDGAKSGRGENREIIKKIAASLSIPVQTGGGIRTMSDIDELLSGGVDRVILGTAALKNPALVREAVLKHGEKIAVGIDAKDGMAAVSGWEEVSATSALELAERVAAMGVAHIIYTDISTDGMLTGPNIAAQRAMAERVGCDIIASGGVGSVADILSLEKTGVGGVIVGKALYTGRVRLDEAIAALRGGNGIC